MKRLLCLLCLLCLLAVGLALAAAPAFAQIRTDVDGNAKMIEVAKDRDYVLKVQPWKQTLLVLGNSDSTDARFTGGCNWLKLHLRVTLPNTVHDSTAAPPTYALVAIQLRSHATASDDTSQTFPALQPNPAAAPGVIDTMGSTLNWKVNAPGDQDNTANFIAVVPCSYSYFAQPKGKSFDLYLDMKKGVLWHAVNTSAKFTLVSLRNTSGNALTGGGWRATVRAELMGGR